MTAQEAAFHTFLFPQLLPPRLSAEDALGWLVRLYRPALPPSHSRGPATPPIVRTLRMGGRHS